MKRILILGASGLMGYTLWHLFKNTGHDEVVGTFLTQPRHDWVHLDIQDSSSVAQLIHQVKPHVVILLASNPSVDYCEQYPGETYQINVKSTTKVIEIVQEKKSKLIYFSSDYVFDGSKERYSEEDHPSPVNEYGRQKLAVEQAIQSRLSDFLILRVSGLYGWEHKGKNFVMQLIHQLKNGQTVELPTDQWYNPSSVVNVAQIVQKLIEADHHGIFHVAGSDYVSRCEFGLKIAQIFGLKDSFIRPILMKDRIWKTPRPRTTGLRIEKVSRSLGVVPWGIQRGLDQMRQTHALSLSNL